MSFIGGLILLALGGIPLLNQFGVIGFGLPDFVKGLIGSIAVYIIAVAALIIFFFSFMEDDMWHKLSLGAGIVLLGLGLVPILNQFGVIGFSIPLDMLYNHIIFVIEGFLLLVASFAMA